MIGTIEQAIIDRLKEISDSGALGYKLREVGSYGGQAKDQKSRASIKDFPAVWVTFTNAPTDQETNSYDRFQAEFALICATENLRNEKAARHGDGQSVGAYQLVMDMAGILGRWSPVDGCGTIKINRVTPLSVDEGRNGLLAVYGLTFTISFQNKRLNPGVDFENPLTAIHTNWDLPPNGNVGPDLPDDENADATSHVTGD